MAHKHILSAITLSLSTAYPYLCRQLDARVSGVSQRLFVINNVRLASRCLAAMHFHSPRDTIPLNLSELNLHTLLTLFIILPSFSLTWNCIVFRVISFWTWLDHSWSLVSGNLSTNLTLSDLQGNENIKHHNQLTLMLNTRVLQNTSFHTKCQVNDFNISAVKSKAMVCRRKTPVIKNNYTQLCYKTRNKFHLFRLWHK